MTPSATDNPRNARVESVARAGEFRMLGPNFQNRLVIQPTDLRQSSPFVVLVEDYMGPQPDDHLHPHRGFETVTFVLEGEIKNVDHTGYRSLSAPGTVQWMTAGSGIMHGGRPHDGTTVHLLQLWLNLPSALRASPPGTREQPRAAALVRQTPGVTETIYGERSRRSGEPAWSRHPMTLTDVELEAGARHALEIAPNERMFVYLLSGAVELAEGRTVSAGEVAWIAVDAAAQRLQLGALEPSRLVACAGPVIDEPSVAHGPFVMTTKEEIRQAHADFNAGRFLSASAVR